MVQSWGLRLIDFSLNIQTFRQKTKKKTASHHFFRNRWLSDDFLKADLKVEHVYVDLNSVLHETLTARGGGASEARCPWYFMIRKKKNMKYQVLTVSFGIFGYILSCCCLSIFILKIQTLVVYRRICFEACPFSWWFTLVHFRLTPGRILDRGVGSCGSPPW